ncbi:COG4223 family protein [Granulibacter bethesdensis]|nr:mitofilin family membrane protein [Granulibacter bethesdensis]
MSEPDKTGPQIDGHADKVTGVKEQSSASPSSSSTRASEKNARQSILPHVVLVLAVGALALGGVSLYLSTQSQPTDPVLQARLEALEENETRHQNPDRPAIKKMQDQLEDLETTLHRQIQSLANAVRVHTGRLDTLQNRPAVQDEKTVGLVEALSKRVDEVTAEQKRFRDLFDSERDRMQAALHGLESRLTKLDAEQQGAVQALQQARERLNEIAGEAGKVTALADRAGRLARLQAASSALSRGEKLGDIPDAPPALTRFAQEAPPTVAALTLSFETVAQHALEASRPDVSHASFWETVKQKAETLVTVRRGDQVLVGDPAAGVIARARKALDAGDLAGAVRTLDALTGPAAQAVSGWKAQAQALLDAQAALSDMAAHA